jgi:hypothetical protein
MQQLTNLLVGPDGLPNFDLILSRSIWATSNPGYVFRDGRKLRSVAKHDYVWDEDEVLPPANLGYRPSTSFSQSFRFIAVHSQ